LLIDSGKKAGRASFQRSEEVGAAADQKSQMKRTGSRESTDSSHASIISDSNAAMYDTLSSIYDQQGSL